MHQASRRKRVGVIVAAWLALLGAACPALAQELRGSVRDSASRLGVPGAVLLLLDADGRQVARSLSNERGQYRIQLDAAVRRVRVIRLGFRPRELPVPAARDGDAHLDVAIARLPRLLETVRSVANPLCPRRSDQAAAFALWEQVRAGLLATVVAREANPGEGKLLVYRRTFEGTSERIVEQSVRADSGKWTKPFTAALTAELFIQYGFLQPGDEGRHTYFGPDAEILLDDAFQAGYCFSLAERERSRPTQIGLRFTPAKRQRERIDIDGTLWIDSTRRVLRDIEFRYVGLPIGAERYRPGGRIEFRELPNGIVVIDRWALRMVGDLVDTTTRRPESPRSLGDLTSGRVETITPPNPNRRLYYANEGGGEIARASWPDGTSLRTPLGKLRLHVLNRLGFALPGQRVLVDSTHYGGTSDSSGTLEIDDLLPGPYRVIAFDPTLAVVDMEGGSLQIVAERDRLIDTTLSVETADDVFRRRCGRTAEEAAHKYLIIARVVDAKGAPLRGAVWQIDDDRGVTDDFGYIVYCKQLEPRRPYEIRVWPARRIFISDAPRTVRVTPKDRLTTVRIELIPDAP